MSPSSDGRIKRRALVVFLVALAPCIIAANRAGVWFASRMSNDGAERAASKKETPIVAVADSLNFGEPWETDAFSWQIVFENTSDKPAKLSAVRGACDCTTVAWEKDVTLKPGERLTVPLVIDLLKLRSYDTSDIRPASVEILAVVRREGAEPLPDQWLMRGQVHRLLHCEPPAATLGEELICGEPGRALEFRLSPNRSINDVCLMRVPEGWSADLSVVRTTPPSYVLRATPRKVRPGTFDDRFELEAVVGEGERVPDSARQCGRSSD